MSFARAFSKARTCATRVLKPGQYRSLHTARPARAGVVPVIDVGPFLNGDKDDKLRVGKELNQACEDIGFFTIVNHGVNKELITDMENVTREYFDLTADEKHLVQMTDDYPYGYIGFEDEALAKGYGEEGSRPDPKECFAIGPHNPAAGMPPVQWPSNPKHLKPIWQNYYASMEDLAANMLSLFATALSLPESWFADKITHHRSALRALNYPELPYTPDQSQIRAGAHTDYGSLTVLLQDSVGGLQVTNRQNEWEDVPYIEGSYVINLGDLMARWTNDRWVSTLHRVMVKQPRRQSIAFFHNINHDHLVKVIETCTSKDNPPKYEPILAWDHLMQKHNASVKGL